MKIRKLVLVFLLLFSGIFLPLQHLYSQRAIPAKPKLQTAVYDEASMLSATEANRLEQKLIRYADTTSTQIVIATISSLQGENIGLYAAEWAHEWGIGQEKEDNGVFLLVAKNDRKIWIATGYGVEEKLTDFTAKTIIDQIITPAFKKGQFYTGLDQGTTAIFQVLQGTFKGSRKASKNSLPITEIIFLLIFFIILIRAFSKNNRGGRGNGGRQSGDSLLDVIILSNMGRGSYGGGSFGGGSSGGFGGGFGGGGFGGGGAGGGW